MGPCLISILLLLRVALLLRGKSPPEKRESFQPSHEVHVNCRAQYILNVKNLWHCIVKAAVYHIIVSY